MIPHWEAVAEPLRIAIRACRSRRPGVRHLRNKIFQLQMSATTVDILIYPGFKAIEAVGAINVFDYANTRLRQLNRPAFYDLRLVAARAEAVQSDTLISLQPDKTLSPLAIPDVAVVVGSRDILGALESAAPIVEWFRDCGRRARKVVGLCSASFFLAEAGLLSGRRAATHWSVAELMQQRYPDIEVDADAIFVRDGDIWTSAGVTAVFDLMLAMVEDDLGRDIALAVARDLVVYLKRPGGQSQFSSHLQSQMTSNPTIRQIQAYINDAPDADLSIAALAERAAMSLRNFSRVFQREVGQSPSDYVEQCRIGAARRVLEETGFPLKRVAAQCGFASEVTLRRAFQRRFGISPSAYRERFAGTGVQNGTEA